MGKLYRSFEKNFEFTVSTINAKYSEDTDAKLRIWFSLLSLGILEGFKASLMPACIWNERLAL